MVPRFFVEPDRAEHTIATLFPSMYALKSYIMNSCYHYKEEVVIARENIRCDLLCELANAGPAKFLNYPFSIWIDAILVQVRWCAGPRR